MTEQEIAQKLDNSGVFNHTICGVTYIRGKCVPYPTADQSEAILAEMGLQVVWYKKTCRLNLFDHPDSYTCTLQSAEFKIKQGQRTLANNAALAWCCTNMRTELERVIGEVK